MFNWLGELFSESPPDLPLPESWLAILDRNAAFRRKLNPSLQELLDGRIRQFIESKYWEGCNGLELNDEHRVTIAAHALRLTLNFPQDLFKDVQTVLLYPTPYKATSQDHIGGGVVVEGESTRLGESWYHGPIILAWSDIKTGIRHRRSRNVISHEFAHVLDYRNGRDADGVPPIESYEQAEHWLEVMQKNYDRHCENCRSHRGTILDCYGATNRAEFFAVSTEVYFEAPERLKAEWPEVYEELHRFYDPSTS